MFDFEHVGDNDLDRSREFVLENGFKVTLKASDPYGFWTVHFEKGGPPKSLGGNYTSFEKAKAALEVYLKESSYHEKKVVATADTALEQEKLKANPVEKKTVDAKKRRKSGRE